MLVNILKQVYFFKVQQKTIKILFKMYFKIQNVSLIHFYKVHFKCVPILLLYYLQVHFLNILLTFEVQVHISIQLSTLLFHKRFLLRQIDYESIRTKYVCYIVT